MSKPSSTQRHRHRSKAPPSKSTDPSQESREDIIDLHEKGYGTRRISRRVGHGRKVVRRVLKEEGRLDQRTQTPASKIAPFRQVIQQKVDKDLTCSRILREIREVGYAGGRTILADHIRELKARVQPPNTKKVKRRFETRPAKEMQIDWSPYTVPIGGVMVMVHAFGCLLAHSRKLFLHFFRNERQSTLLEALAMAFEYFDGCAARLVTDNMATAVLARYVVDGKPLWHQRFAEFVAHYGIEPFACHVRDPDRKGKKEKSFRLVWDDLLKGSDFDSLDDLNRRARSWLDETPETANLRVHGTTRRVPNQAYLSERDLLIRLPHQRFPVYEPSVRVVDQDATISVRGTRYTVPAHLANSSVQVRLFAEHFEVLDRQGRLAFSRRHVPDADKGKLIIDPTHYATVRPHTNPGGSRRLEQAFLDRYSQLAPLVTGLQGKMKSLTHIHIRALLRLAEQYGQQAFIEAATRAQNYRRYDALAVRRILERRHGPADDTPLPALTARGADLVGDVDSGDLDTYGHLDTDDTDDNNEEE